MMKKLIWLFGAITVLLLMSFSVSAGDIPESILAEDGAQLYIGRVDSVTTLDKATLSHEENAVVYIDITPTHKYKGDVETGVSQHHTKHDFGDFIPEVNNEYLFAYINEDNFYIYEIKSRSDDEIRLVDSNVHNIINRLEDYINSGAVALAEQERLSVGKQISFAEYLFNSDSVSDFSVEKITLRYQDNLCEVDKGKFLEIAQDIMIVGVKNEPLYETREGSEVAEPYKTVLYIEVLDEYEKVFHYAAISKFGEVDRYGLFMSRLMAKDYEMKLEDLSKLYSLFPADVQKNIIMPESVSGSTETLPLILPEVPVKDYTGKIAFGVSAVFLFAFIVGFIVSRKIKKQ